MPRSSSSTTRSLTTWLSKHRFPTSSSTFRRRLTRSRVVWPDGNFDRFVERSYLEKLIDAYARFFHTYDDGPLLIVNASEIDPVNNEADYMQLYQQIERTGGGRHFFNPVAAALA